jgi:hypothetical protein
MFLSFLSAWLKDFWARMAGGVSLVFTLLGFVIQPERARGVFFLTALLAFIYGAYHVWSKERKALEARQAELDEEKSKNARPNLRVEIQEVYPEFTVSATGQHPYYIDYYFTVKVHLANEGRAIAVRRFELYANFNRGVKPMFISPLDHLALERKQRLTPKWSVAYSTVETVQGPLNELSQDKTPITYGDGREGWLRFVLPEISNEELSEITGITLCVVDTESNVHKTKADRIQWRQSGELVNTYHQEIQREAEREKVKEKARRRLIHDGLGEWIEQGRRIERESASEHWKPLWRGRVLEFLRNAGGTHARRFQESDLENDIATLEEIQKEFVD